MKKIILAFLTAILCWSCENEIGPLNLTEPPTLIVNALLSTQSEDNNVHLYLTGTYETTCISDGIVRLYINGQAAETITAVYNANLDYRQRYYYPVKSHFKAGDMVRLEAETSDGMFRAWAETKVPVPPEVTRIDTLSVMLKDYVDAVNYNPYYQLKLQLKEQSDEQEQYFRILAGIHCNKNYTLTYREWKHYPDYGGGRFVTTVKDTTFVEQSYQLIYRDDIALNDGKPQVSDDYIGLTPETENHFQVFNNQYFNDSRYTMTVNIRKSNMSEDIPIHDLYPNPDSVQFNNASKEIVHHLIAISKEEYNYLKGLGLRMDIEMDEPIFFEPNIIPGNIHGGTGIFAIENWNTGKMLLD